eukprot:8515484-Karenia_brevis.AAC.1
MAFSDGSRLYAEHDLYGLCARHGWAFAAYDHQHRLVAAAQGRAPPWATGIHATELWGLLMAVQSVDPQCKTLIDCQAVHKGCARDISWANAPARTFGRAWGPLIASVCDQPDRVIWMPAHCTGDFSHRVLSNGAPLLAEHVQGNDTVDALAKQ